MIHSSYYRPRVYPVNNGIDSAEIDRLQELTGSATLNRTKIEEIGRDGTVCWRKVTPTVSLSLRQLEYGSLEFWQKLANKETTVTKIEMTDFKTPMVDIAGYKTDDDGDFLGTIWYPKCRTSAVGMTIGDPDAVIERAFTLIGEDQIDLQAGNKYLIQLERVIASGESGAINIVIGGGSYTNWPDPAEDPDNSGNYMLRCVKYEPGAGIDANNELIEGVDYTYDNGTKTIGLINTVAGEVYTFMYSAATYITGEEPFVDNDSDLCGLIADTASIYLQTSDYVYRLQSVSIDVSFDRFDVKEIGNQEIVQRGIRDTTVRITLGRILEDYTIEEILRGVGGLDYGKIDIREMRDDITLVVKLYTDNKKDTFAIGYKFTNLTPSGIDAGAPLNDYVTRGVTLEGEEGFVTDDENEL